jgi:hypothetical protein
MLPLYSAVILGRSFVERFTTAHACVLVCTKSLNIEIVSTITTIGIKIYGD